MSTKIKKALHPKKELREKISMLLHSALTTFRTTLNEKKLNKLLKKAARILADGLHSNKRPVAAVNKKVAAKKVKRAPKKAVKKK